MTAYKNGIAEFIGMKEFLTYCSMTDPGEVRLEGFSTKKSIGCQTRSGVKHFDAKSYISCMEKLRPNLFTLLCDFDTSETSSKKRTQKSLEITINIFEKCLKAYEDSEILQKHSQAVGALVGGYDTIARETCSQIVGKSSVFGVVIEGLHKGGREVEEMSISKLKPVIEASLVSIILSISYSALWF